MSKPKYKPGSKILTINELLSRLESDGVVYWRGKVQNKRWITCLQLELVIKIVKNGSFKVAEKNENN
jgi:hypothetical protein